jgi:riboflavin biosynthesis pyrimidine reductase
VDQPLFDRLRPGPQPVRAAELLAEVRPRERSPEDRPFVLVNMVSTADGRAAVGGTTRPLGGEADIALLVELREMADAVMIGSGTLRAEGYGRLMRRADRRERRVAAGLTAEAPVVLLSRSMDLPWDAGLFEAPEQPVWLYTGPDSPPPPEVAAPIELVRLERPTPRAALQHLRKERGVRALLSEGGPQLNAAMLADGLIDELFLTLSAVLTGDESEPTIVAGALPEPTRLALRWLLHADGELYLRYAVGAGAEDPAAGGR